MAACERCGRRMREWGSLALRGRELSFCGADCLAHWAVALVAMSSVERPDGTPLRPREIERMVRRG